MYFASELTFTINVENENDYLEIKKQFIELANAGKFKGSAAAQSVDGEHQIRIEAWEGAGLDQAIELAKVISSYEFEMEGYVLKDSPSLDFKIESKCSELWLQDAYYDELCIEDLDYDEFLEECAEKYDEFEDEEVIISQISKEEYEEILDDDSLEEYFLFVNEDMNILRERPQLGENKRI